MAVLGQKQRPRLTTPLVRIGAALEPASWDVALKRAAELFQQVKGQFGGNALGVFSSSKSTNELNYLASKFARVVFGTHNIDSCNRT